MRQSTHGVTGISGGKGKSCHRFVLSAGVRRGMKSKTSLRDSVSKEAMFFLLKNAKKRSRYKLKILFDFFIIPISSRWEIYASALYLNPSGKVYALLSMQDVIDDEPANVQKAILHHDEGVDLLPSNIELSGLEVRLINAISRESVLKTCINEVKKNYDTVLIDCMPSLGMLTINALRSYEKAR